MTGISTLPKLREISEQIARCRLCKLGTGNARPVPGEGNPHASAMLVGEAPGFYEDQQGRPFVGPAGQLLDQLLKVAGFARSDVFITNVIKHRPPGNRDPEEEEIVACDAFLRAQIAAISPKVIVTLGRYSLAKFMPNVRSMKEVHGKAFPYEGRLVCAMYHPAAALHQGSLRSVLEQDFRTLPMIITRAEARLAPVNEHNEGALAPQESSAEQMALW
jgi:uracil-DNA glycosylase family 4